MDLDDALGVVSSQGLVATQYQVKETGLSDLADDWATSVVRLVPEYDGTQSIEVYAKRYWSRQQHQSAHDVEQMQTAEARRGGISPRSAITRSIEIRDYFDDMYTECADGDCPDVPNVVAVKVRGTLVELTSLALTPAFQTLDFSNGMIDNNGQVLLADIDWRVDDDSPGGGGSNTSVSASMKTKLEACRRMHDTAPRPVGPPSWALDSLLNLFAVSRVAAIGASESGAISSSREKQLGSHQQDHFEEWQPEESNLYFTRWIINEDDEFTQPAPGDNPAEDYSRAMESLMYWFEDNLAIYKTPFPGGREYDCYFAYEHKFKLNREGPHLPGVYVDHEDEPAVKCIPVGILPPIIPVWPPLPISPVVCFLNPAWSEPILSFFSCNLPRCYLDNTLEAPSAYTRFGAGTGRADLIEPEKYYRVVWDAFPAEINGTGLPDMDTGCIEPQLHWGVPGARNDSKWWAGGNGHAEFRIDPAHCYNGIDPIPLAPSGGQYPVEGELWFDVTIVGEEVEGATQFCP